MGSMEVAYETIHALSTDTMIFDFGWPWTVLNLGHRSNILEMMRDMMLDAEDIR